MRSNPLRWLALLLLAVVLATPAISLAEGATTYQQLVDLLNAGGDIVLGDDIEVTAALPINRKVTFAGSHILTRGGSYKGAIFEVVSGGDLTLQDVTLNGQNDADVTAPLVKVTSGKFTMRGAAKLTNNANYGALNGSAISTIHITDNAVISNNRNATTGGGGITVTGWTILTIDGFAKITGNSSTVDSKLNCAGGVYAKGSGTTVSGQAEISGNTAILEGGGISANNGILTIKGGAGILNNTVTVSKSGYNAAGAGVNLDSNANCIIEGCARISGNTSAYNGGGIDVEESRLTLRGDASITDNKAANGAGVLMYSGGFGGISGNVMITGNIASASGGGVFVTGDTTTISGNVIIADNSAKNGGGIFTEKATTLEGHTQILSNNATVDGGGIHMQGATLTIKGDTIIAKNNDGVTAAKKGDGIFAKKCIVHIGDNVNIWSNNAEIGGGLYVEESNATITGNTSIHHNKTNGISVIGNSPVLLQENVTVSDNAVGLSWSGQDKNSDGEVGIQDAVSIHNNYKGTNRGYDVLYDLMIARVWISAPLKGGSNIGFISENIKYMTLAANVNKTHVISENDKFQMRDMNTTAPNSEIWELTIYQNMVMELQRDSNEHFVEVFLPDGYGGWTFTDDDDYWWRSLYNAYDFYVNGSYRKSSEREFKLFVRRQNSGEKTDETLIVPDGVTITLSGSPVTQGDNARPLFRVMGGGKLILSGITLNGNGKQANTGSLIEVEPNGTLVLDSGAVINGCVSTDNGAAIFNKGHVIINKNAIIENCKAGGNGGAIYTNYAGSTITMNGGTLVGNKATSGGAIFATLFQDNAFTMTGGTIRNNTATGNGGGVYIHNKGWKIENGAIFNNTAGNGGGVYTYNAPLTLAANSIISGNQAAFGGGLFQMGDSPCASSNLQGVIRDNTATVDGGGVYSRWGAMSIADGASIIRNAATQHGGAIYVDNPNGGNPAVTVGSAAVNGNTAASGAGVYILHGNVSLNGASVTNNTANHIGGVYKNDASDARVSMGGAVQLLDNTGGNLYLPGNDTFTVTDRLSNAAIGVTTARSSIPSAIGTPSSSLGTVVAADADCITVDSNPNLEAMILNNRIVLGELPTYAYNTPSPATVTSNGLTLSVSFNKAGRQVAGTFVTATYSLTGTAIESGKQTIGFTGRSSQEIAVYAGQDGSALSFTKSYTFQILEQDVTDLALFNSFAKLDVSSVSVSTQPKLLYSENDPLDLSAMRLLVTFSDNSTATIPYQSSNVAVKITNGSAIQNGATLTKAAHAGKTLTATYQGKSAVTQALQVKLTSKAITSFEILGQSATINESLKTVTLQLPFSTTTNLASLTPTIVHTGTQINPASGSVTDFTSAVSYTVTAENGSAAVYTASVSMAPSNLCSITAFTIPNQVGATTYDHAAKTITVNMPNGTSVASLTPAITIVGKSVSPASGTAKDFTSPVSYTVTADDNTTTATYTVTVNVLPSSACSITAFTIPNQVGATTYDHAAKTITVTMPNGTSVASLTPAITIVGKSVSPASGTAKDFTSPVSYTVTADDNTTTATYMVTVNVLPSSACSITAFTIPNQVGATTYDHDARTITVTMPNGTSVASLTPAITIVGKSVSPASGTAKDFTSPVSYTVTADDNTTTATYTVTVNVLPSSACSITAFTIPNQVGATTYDHAAKTIAVTMPNGTSVASLTPAITIVGKSVSPASGTAKDFTSPVSYTVTADDNTTTATYTVTVNVQSALGMSIAPRASFYQGASGGSYVLTVGHGTTLAPDDITAVTIDGAPLREHKDYTKMASHSVDVTLTEACLNRLTEGTHRIEAHVTRGQFAVQKPSVTVTVAAPPPKTGDQSPVGLLLVLLAISAAGIASSVLRKRRA